MPTRTEQVQAHQFLIGRLVSALVHGDPDAPATPGRRLGLALFAGVLVGLLAVAVVGVFGLLVPGGATAWRKPGALIVEKDTGARYLLVDGVLRPVLNFTSAKLLIGDQLTVTPVTSASLRGVPHGGPVGIPGAPDELPDPAKLSTEPWRLCAGAGTDAGGTTPPLVSVAVGGVPGRGLGSGLAALVRDPNGGTYLIWAGHRLRVSGRWVLDALGYGQAQPGVVGAGWLSAIPVGPDLRSIPVPARGAAGPVVGGRPTRVGQVLTLMSPDGRNLPYAVLRDGLAALSQTDAALLLADPATAAAYPSRPQVAEPVAAAAVAAAPHSRSSGVTDGFPASPPGLVALGAGQAVCVEVPPGGQPLTLSVAQLPTTGVQSPGYQVRRTSLTASVVTVEPDRGVLVQDLPAPGAAAGALYLVTDLGVKYPLTGSDAAQMLGYGDATPVALPASVLALLPTGPTLDPQVATGPVTGDAAAGPASSAGPG